MIALLLAPATPPPDLSGMVTKTAAHTYQVDAVKFDAALARPELWARGGRVVPHYRDGKSAGFKLFGLRPGSLYVALGLRNGDLVRAISGRPMTSPHAVLALYTWAKTAKRIELDVERAGKPLTLAFDIVGPGRVDGPPPEPAPLPAKPTPPPAKPTP